MSDVSLGLTVLRLLLGPVLGSAAKKAWTATLGPEDKRALEKLVREALRTAVEADEHLASLPADRQEYVQNHVQSVLGHALAELDEDPSERLWDGSEDSVVALLTAATRSPRYDLNTLGVDLFSLLSGFLTALEESVQAEAQRHGSPLFEFVTQEHLVSIRKTLSALVSHFDRLPGCGGGTGMPGMRMFFRHLIESHTELFAGREQEITQILDFIKTAGTGYVFVEGLSGYGKTSLLAHLVDKHPEFHYHFISQSYKRFGAGFDPTRLADLLKSLCEQLNPGYAAVGELRDLELEFLRLLAAPLRKPTVIVLDAIDEVDRHPNYLRGLLPLQLRDGCVIILSARTQGDRNYLSEVGLDAMRIKLYLRLPGLDETAIIKLLNLAGQAASPLAEDREFVAKLYDVSGGDPFYIRFLVEDVASGTLGPQNVHNYPSGLTAYLDKQLQILNRNARRAYHRQVLGLILAAEQPLGRKDLEAMVPGLNRFNFDDVLRDIHRFLLVQDDQYTFCHDRFREYFASR